jgi:glycosyltransferase involved in cell wall biosynthesis
MQTSSVLWRGRVALIAGPGGPNTGIGRYVQMLHAGLREAGVDSVRVASTLPPLPTTSYRFFHWLGRDLHAFLRNFPIWSTYPRADIYHFTSQTLATLLLFCRPKGRVVVTVHDIIPYMLHKDPEFSSSYGDSINHLFNRLAMAGLKRADCLIAISEDTKQCLVEHLGIVSGKIAVVHQGIDHERFRPLQVPATIRARYGLPEGRRYIIYVGSEEPRKNLVTLVRALAHLRRELPDVEVVKVGRAHFDRERQRLIGLASQLGVRTAIHFLEDVPEDDLPLLYSLADVCVMPSLYEGFGFPVLEAMACGTPVVSANTGALREIVSNAGVQVCPHDADTLACTLLALLKDQRQQLLLRRAGRDRAAKFAWTATVQRTAAVYNQLVPANSDGGPNAI